MNIAHAFDADRRALVGACLRIADAALRGPVPRAPQFAAHVRGVAEALQSGTWEVQASAAASLRSWFHRDGVTDSPAPPGAPNWDDDLRTLWDLSTIYVESRYGDIARARSAG